MSDQVDGVHSHVLLNRDVSELDDTQLGRLVKTLVNAARRKAAANGATAVPPFRLDLRAAIHEDRD